MAHGHAQPGIDPRKIITPESFHVAPHLLGLPLASPSRRLAAILLDLLLVAILANVGGKILFALAMAVAFFWFAGKRLGNRGGFFSRSVRAAFRGIGALMLFIACIATWSAVRDDGEDADEEERAAVATATVVSPGGASSSGNVMPAARMVAALVMLERAEDSASADRLAREAVVRLRQLDKPNNEIRAALVDAVKDRPAPVKAGVNAALPAADTLPAKADSAGAAARPDTVPTNPDSLAAAYVTAVREGDSTRAGFLRPKLASTFAGDSLSELRGNVRELREENSTLRSEKEEAESRGILGTLLKWLDDLGLGFGWTGLYFTFFTVMMRGQTPAKRLFGIRVLRLDGQPITLWASFERFGGYAAGLFTGLIGYMQVFWDRNRQGIQDKISETVVIRDRGAPLPTPAVRPGQPPYQPHGPRPFGLPHEPAPYPPQGPHGAYPPHGPQQPHGAQPYGPQQPYAPYPPQGPPPLGSPYGPPQHQMQHQPQPSGSPHGPPPWREGQPQHAPQPSGAPQGPASGGEGQPRPQGQPQPPKPGAGSGTP